MLTAKQSAEISNKYDVLADYLPKIERLINQARLSGQRQIYHEVRGGLLHFDTLEIGNPIIAAKLKQLGYKIESTTRRYGLFNQHIDSVHYTISW